MFSDRIRPPLTLISGWQEFLQGLTGKVPSGESLQRESEQYMRKVPPTRNPKPETRNPQPETRNPKPSTLNPQPSTLWHAYRKVTR